MRTHPFLQGVKGSLTLLSTEDWVLDVFTKQVGQWDNSGGEVGDEMSIPSHQSNGRSDLLRCPLSWAMSNSIYLVHLRFQLSISQVVTKVVGLRFNPLTFSHM